jgi:hypothetical protein
LFIWQRGTKWQGVHSPVTPFKFDKKEIKEYLRTAGARYEEKRDLPTIDEIDHALNGENN